MSKQNPKLLISVRNHLSPLRRLRKGIIGAVLFVLSLYLVFGPDYAALGVWIYAFGMLAALLALGFGWSGLSHGLMGWSRQVDIDFEKNEVRQVSASLLGRSKPFTIPLVKIADFVVKTGAVAGEGGDREEAAIELQDKTGRAMIIAGMFDNVEEAEAVRQRMVDAQRLLLQTHSNGWA